MENSEKEEQDRQQEDQEKSQEEEVQEEESQEVEAQAESQEEAQAESQEPEVELSLDERISVKEVSVKYGLYLGIILTIYSLALQVMGLAANEALGWVGYVVLIVLMVIAHKTFKNEGDGFMSYSQGLSIGTLIALVAGLISTPLSYLYVKFVDSSFLQVIKDKQFEAMEQKGMSDAEIESAMEIASTFMTAEFIFPIAFIAFIFFGFIISLIVTAFTKNSNPQLDM